MKKEKILSHQSKTGLTENGRSMIEMLGVLAIIGVLSVGGIAGYTKAMYRLKMNKTIDIVNRIFHELEELSSHRFNNEDDVRMFSSTSNSQYGLADYLETLREICNGVDRNQGTGRCPLPIGEISASLYTYDHIQYGTMGNFEADFYVTFSGGNRIKQCVDFLSYDWVHAVPQEYWTAEDGAILIGPYWDVIFDKRTNYSLAKVAEYCSKCADYDKCIVEIAFYYY